LTDKRAKKPSRSSSVRILLSTKSAARLPRSFCESSPAVFAQTTNGLGALLVGIAAQYMGASNALLVGSGLCFLMILGICIAIPQLWHYRS